MYDTINTSDFGGSVHKYYGKSKIDDNKSIISTNIGTIYEAKEARCYERTFVKLA